MPPSIRRTVRRILCLLILSAPGALPAQESLPVLRAHSTQVDIQDGDVLLKGAWTVDPTVALDVYDVRRSALGKKVTFITDLGSLSFDVQPGRTYDFTLLLDDKVACPTRISTLTQGFKRTATAPLSGPVTIPISISHGKLHLQGRFNDSKPLDLIFDTGADIQVLYPSALRKGARLQFDGSVNNVGTGGRVLRRTSSDNHLEVGGLAWDHERVLYIEKQADHADGIVGYPVFQDKVVELDFDRMLMIVHEVLPAHASGFTKTAMPPAGTLTAVETGLGLGARRESGPLVLDTGGSGTLTVNAAFARAHGLSGAVRKLGNSTLGGVGPAVIRADLVLLPELTLAGQTLKNVPITVELPADGPPAPPGGALFMEVLSRFNLLFDYPRNEAYFKPNARFSAPFKMGSTRPPWVIPLGLASVSAASLFAVTSLVAKRRRRALGNQPPSPIHHP